MKFEIIAQKTNGRHDQYYIVFSQLGLIFEILLIPPIGYVSIDHKLLIVAMLFAFVNTYLNGKATSTVF
jgi:hypothetical protein